MSDAFRPDPRTSQRLAHATRFFARVQSFDLECPRCGKVYLLRGHRITENWDPRTARFTCTVKSCRRRFVVGIVAWPIQRAGTRAATATPMDQVPGPRELSQLRKEGGGWWLADEASVKYARPVETNLTTSERPDRDPEDDQLVVFDDDEWRPGKPEPESE